MEQINNCSSLLPDVELDFIYNDTQGDVLKSNAVHQPQGRRNGFVSDVA